MTDKNKKVLAGALLLLSIFTVLFGIYRDELRVIWNNGKILCLTCIGIK
ncbi:thioredoxin [Phorcysia thermohydrogeniphila]|nr:thioredoxin [Phorcysia thermohydrogeniphila]